MRLHIHDTDFRYVTTYVLDRRPEAGAFTVLDVPRNELAPAGVPVPERPTVIGELEQVARDFGLALTVDNRRLITPPEMLIRPFRQGPAFVGQRFYREFQAENVTGKPVFEFVGDSIDGLVFDPLGRLTGIPNLTGVFPFSIRVTDLLYRQTERAYELPIISP